METATTIAAFTSLFLNIVIFAWHIYKMKLEKDEVLEKVKKMNEDFKNKKFFQVNGSINFPLSEGEQLDSLAKLNGLERKENETDDQLRQRLSKFIKEYNYSK